MSEEQTERLIAALEVIAGNLNEICVSMEGIQGALYDEAGRVSITDAVKYLGTQVFEISHYGIGTD